MDRRRKSTGPARPAAPAAAIPAPDVADIGGKHAKHGKGGYVLSSAPVGSEAPPSAADGFMPGTQVFAKYRDGTDRKAVVLERAPMRDEAGALTGEFRYYVHYMDFNRRMDTWVNPRDVTFDAEGDAAAKQEARLKAESARVAAAAGLDADIVMSHTGKGGKSKTGAGGSVPIQGLGDGQEIVDVDGTRLRAHRNQDGTMVIGFVEPDHEADGMQEKHIREHEEVTKVKNVNFIEVGRYRMETWYFSPLPPEYWPDGVTDTLYFCEFCLKFFLRKSELLHHASKCTLKHPPGDEIYRGADGIGMWEVDGTKEKFYCQNLAYLAKMFLDHKTLMYDVDLFFFYVMTELDEYGYHIVGYFSKEKYSDIGYNLACILSLPAHQRKGYGRFLIQFSYELSKLEKKVGSPEKPLSDLGFLSYRSYWSWVILGLLRNWTEPEISIMRIMEITSIRAEDIISTLQHLGMLRYVNGQHVITAIADVMEKEFQRLNSKPGPVVDPSRIHWAPYKPFMKRDKWAISSKLQGHVGGE